MPLPQPTSRTRSPPAIRVQEFFDEVPGRGMVAISESTWSELDQPREIPAIVLRPRMAHAQPPVERDRVSVSKPRLQGGASLWPRHRHQALGSKRHDEAGHAPLVVHRSQHHPAGVAGRHDIHRAHTECSQPVAHPGELVLGGRNRDHRDTMPQPRPCGRTGVGLGSRCGQ